MKAKEAMVIGAVAIDKHQLLLNRPTSITAKTGGLEALAAEFEKLSRQHQAKVVSEQ